MKGSLTDIEALKVAILIPCHNEESTIAKTIQGFQQQLPDAAIYVFDNCSTDSTAKIAERQGAAVIKEAKKGKGFVVKNMFETIYAKYYVMVDGDNTYPSKYVNKLLEPVIFGASDMVVGARALTSSKKCFPPLHRFGNKLVCLMINKLLDAELTDAMSGYRAFNRKVVECITINSSGFEIETEISLKMLHYGLKISEIKIPYFERPHGSYSKLKTFKDGFRILWKILTLSAKFKISNFFSKRL